MTIGLLVGFVLAGILLWAVVTWRFPAAFGPAGSGSYLEGSFRSPAPDPSPVTAPLAPSRPVRVTIPAIEVRAPIDATGLRDDGNLETPDQDEPGLVGWYDGSASPGEAGRSVLLGHVDTDETAHAVFHDLDRLEPGDRILVTRKDGTTAVFDVYATDVEPRDRLPVEKVFGPSEGAELRLITCGGTYDENAGGWQSNILVHAKLTSSRS